MLLVFVSSRTMCSATGDPHYITFDGLLFHFQGKCKYLLVGTTAANNLYPPFKILVRNKKWDKNADVATTKYVELHIYDYVIKIDQKKIITVTYLIVSSTTVVNFDLSLPMGVSVYKSGIVETDFGLRVSFDGNYNLFVNIPDDMIDMTEGLCGDHNLDQFNDLTKQNGVLTTNVNGFGNSWKVFDPDNLLYVVANYSCIYSMLILACFS